MDIFERLNREKPPPEEKAKRQPKELAEALLGWLERWPKQVLTLNDLRNYAPRSIRNKETAIRSAQILTAHGHLKRLAAHKWQIVREGLTPTHSQ